MSYTLELEPLARRQLKAFKGDIHRRLSLAIDALADEPRPHGCLKLVSLDEWRIRVGDYRIVYKINDPSKRVTISEVTHRSGAY